ncbi:MAG: metalloregulator ArsR/SmtB family transcription factor [Lachnospiraceae bacterium]|nr:metalloregulator ArsR/SmtB family transcription factor [Lachnospiraceae bacterium]
MTDHINININKNTMVDVDIDINEIQKNLPNDDILNDLAELFKVFGDTTRVRILCVLFESEMCVNDIAGLLGMTQSAISHQLSVLKSSKLVKSRKAGKSVFYSLDDDHIKHIFDQGLAHVTE